MRRRSAAGIDANFLSIKKSLRAARIGLPPIRMVVLATCLFGACTKSALTNIRVIDAADGALKEASIAGLEAKTLPAVAAHRESAAAAVHLQSRLTHAWPHQGRPDAEAERVFQKSGAFAGVDSEATESPGADQSFVGTDVRTVVDTPIPTMKPTTPPDQPMLFASALLGGGLLVSLAIFYALLRRQARADRMSGYITLDKSIWNPTTRSEIAPLALYYGHATPFPADLWAASAASTSHWKAGETYGQSAFIETPAPADAAHLAQAQTMLFYGHALYNVPAGALDAENAFLNATPAALEASEAPQPEPADESEDIGSSMTEHEPLHPGNGGILAQAKRDLMLGHHHAVIDGLQDLLTADAGNAQAWALAGAAWWHLSKRRDGDALQSASHAAAAFRRAVQAEPLRFGWANRAIGRCHLLCASVTTGEVRVQHLDSAILALSPCIGHPSVNARVLIEWAGALFERSLAQRDSGEHHLAEVQRALEAYAGPKILADKRAWLLARTLMERARRTTTAAAIRMQDQARALFLTMDPGSPATAQDDRLTLVIEHEQALAIKLQAAARIARLRELQHALDPVWPRVQSAGPILAWINLLHVWSTSLRGTLALAKLAEAELLFSRVATITPEARSTADFARAYYLRLCAKYESSSSALTTLRDATALLEGVSSTVIPPALLYLEGAEIALARGGLIDGTEANDTLLESRDLAWRAIREAPHDAVLARCCLIKASMALAHRGAYSDMSELAKQALVLDETANDNAHALVLAAKALFQAGHPALSCSLFARAWDAGALSGEVLPSWQKALSMWRAQARTSEQEPAWQQANRTLRLVQGCS